MFIDITVRSICVISAALTLSGCSAPHTTVPIEMREMMSHKVSSLYRDDSNLCINENSADCIMMTVLVQAGLNLNNVRLPDYAYPGGAQIRMIYCNIEARYVVSWVLHLSDTNVIVVSNKARIVESSTKGKTMHKYEMVRIRNRKTQDSYLDCWKETSGPWYDKAMATLLQRFKSANRDSKGRINIRKFVDEVANQYCLSFVFDPKISNIEVDRLVEFDGEYENIKKALKVICERAGMQYSVLGSMIYVYPAEASDHSSTNDEVK